MKTCIWMFIADLFTIGMNWNGNSKVHWEASKQHSRSIGGDICQEIKRNGLLIEDNTQFESPEPYVSEKVPKLIQHSKCFHLHELLSRSNEFTGEESRSVIAGGCNWGVNDCKAAQVDFFDRYSWLWRWLHGRYICQSSSSYKHKMGTFPCM